MRYFSCGKDKQYFSIPQLFFKKKITILMSPLNFQFSSCRRRLFVRVTSFRIRTSLSAVHVTPTAHNGRRLGAAAASTALAAG
jgi:hypothetical protein